jgi:hypothetical protein
VSLQLDHVNVLPAAVVAQQGQRRDGGQADQRGADPEPGAEPVGERDRQRTRRTRGGTLDPADRDEILRLALGALRGPEPPPSPRRQAESAIPAPLIESGSN